MFLGTACAVLFCHGAKKKISVFFITPAIFYTLFYNYNYALYLSKSTPIVITYLGAFFSTILVIWITSCKKIPYCSIKQSNKKQASNIKTTFSLFSSFCIQGFLLLLLQTIPWAIDTFPLSNIEAVLFTLFAGTNDGAEEFVISSFSNRVGFTAIKFFAFILISQLTISIFFRKKQIALEFSLWKTHQKITGPTIKDYIVQLQKSLLIFLLVYFGISSLVIPGIVMSTPFKALFQQPINSELYQNHYIPPDHTQISISKAPKNLIVIFLESMEVNFARFTPEITTLEQQSTNFLPGGVCVSGTSWTIAGITGKLCGIPLNMPMGINEYHGKLPTYVPGAKCLMDVLAEKAYSQVYLQGSSGDFTQKRTFWTVHGNVAVHDIEYYKKIGKIEDNYYEFWGFEDRKLYQFAKEELDSLYKLDKPFALYMLTIDTHQPNGYIDSICSEEFENIEGDVLKAIRCASKQLYDFISWAKTQPWFESTVISVMGDHTMPSFSSKVGIPSSDSLYWTNFMLNSAIQQNTKARQYSSLDVFPTLLESMNFTLKNRGVALGRSLFSDSLTMLELYGRSVLDSLLRERSIQYDSLLFGKK